MSRSTKRLGMSAVASRRAEASQENQKVRKGGEQVQRKIKVMLNDRPGPT